MITLLIIADDFTGALDTGVKFSSKGAIVRVVTDYQYDFCRASKVVQVLVMDAETRHLESGQAYDRVYGIVKRAKEAGIPYIYKKTDSALRGNIGSELTALLNASGGERIHFFPAFPKMGRTTQNGFHYIHNVPVQESVFGKDPFEPVESSYVPDIIAKQSDVSVKVLNEVSLKEADNQQTGIMVYDAQSDEELKKIGGALKEKQELAVLAGCAGMAEMMPELLGIDGIPPQIPKFIQKLTVICGSINPITRRQLDYAESRGFKRLRLFAEQKLESGYFDTERGKKEFEDLRKQCESVSCSIIDTNDLSNQTDTVDYAKCKNMSTEDVRVQISKNLGFILRKMIKEGLNSTILITGGDTLLGFMNQLEESEMIPICEIAPGAVLSQLKLEGKYYEVISKSGGFGEESILIDLAVKIMGEERL